MNRRQKLVQQEFLNNEAGIIRRLDQVYTRALKDVDVNIERLMKRFDPETGDLPQSAIYQLKYQNMLKAQLEGTLQQMHTQQFTSVSQYLDGCYTDGFIGNIFDLHGQDVPLVMPIDQEAMVRAVQLDSPISQGLYTRLGEDVAVLKKKITAQVSRSIATGTSFADCARQLAGYTRIGYNNAIRIARTEGHRIQNTAIMDSMDAAVERGADVVKQWDATLDGKTRESHVAVDGEIREKDEKFSNGLMYPGDPAGGAAEVINCRCRLNQRARWALDDGSFTKWNNFTGQLETFDSPQSYAKFKEAFFSDENRRYMNYVEQMQDKYHTKDWTKIIDQMNTREYNYYSTLLQANPVYNRVENSGKSGIIEADGIIVPKSLGAKATNYDIELPNHEIVHLTEGTRITNIKVIAGKGRDREIDEINILLANWGGSAFEWQKKKGIGYVDYEGESYRAELHWYEEPTAGRHKWKVKPDADGNWFLED